MSKLKALAAATVARLRAQLSPSAAINLLVPRKGYSVMRGLAYGLGPRQRLDVYVPSKPQDAPAPVLLFFYGGGWQGGNRRRYRAFGQAFASAGLLTVVADYRLYPQVKYPGFVEDAAAALVFLHGQAARFGGDPGRIFIAGHSAGAYNAVMLASEPRFLADKGGSLDWIRGVIGIAGPYDALPMRDPVYVDIFHGSCNTDSMPLYHVDGRRPPMLLVTGSRDHTVGPGNTLRMAERLRAAGSEVKVIAYDGVGHVGIILSLVALFRRLAPLRQDMLDFIRAH
jgi:acetyl esterase/lipase